MTLDTSSHPCIIAIVRTGGYGKCLLLCLGLHQEKVWHLESMQMVLLGCATLGGGRTVILFFCGLSDDQKGSNMGRHLMHQTYWSDFSVTSYSGE